MRIADAGVFPEITTANPMLTVLAIGERAAEMIAEETGWRNTESETVRRGASVKVSVVGAR